MCALFGWLDYKGNVPYNILKKLTQTLANAAEERGTDAAGIAYIRDNNVKIYKRPRSAYRIHFNIPYGTHSVMGHTRMATQGDKKHNFNNHPFHGHADIDFAFAHNGIIYNDTALRKEKGLPDTKIETDSYVAVQLIEQQENVSFNTLKQMAEAVHGSFTFTLLDESGKLYIIKGSNPMCLLHFESLGLFVYASTETIVNKALKQTGFSRLQPVSIQLAEGDMISIDKYGIAEKAEFKPYIGQYYGKQHYFQWYDDYMEAAGYNFHEELLLDICHIYGVDEEDILLLLDYGYSCDEIEEMLTDYDLINETLKLIKMTDDFVPFPIGT